ACIDALHTPRIGHRKLHPSQDLHGNAQASRTARRVPGVPGGDAISTYEPGREIPVHYHPSDYGAIVGESRTRVDEVATPGLWRQTVAVRRYGSEVAMTAMVQAQSLRGYRELVHDLGGNPSRLLRKSGIEPTAINQLTAFITFESLIDLLEHSATDLSCP